MNEEDLLKLKLKVEKEIHKMQMELVAYRRESERLKHEDELTRGRIRTAEIRKSQERQNWRKY